VTVWQVTKLKSKTTQYFEGNWDIQSPNPDGSPFQRLPQPTTLSRGLLGLNSKIRRPLGSIATIVRNSGPNLIKILVAYSGAL